MTLLKFLIIALLSVGHWFGHQTSVNTIPGGLPVGATLITPSPQVGLGGTFGATGRDTVNYNQGLALGDYALMYRATHRRAYLKRAQEIATASAKAFGDFGYNSKAPGQAPAFSAIYFRNLALLGRIVPNATYVAQRARFVRFLNSHPVHAAHTTRYRNGLYHDPAYPSYPFAFVWQTSQAVAAQELRYPQRTRILRFYWEPRSHAFGSALKLVRGRPTPYGDLYYDDNAWVALDYLAAYDRTRYRPYLVRAEQDFRFLAGGWSRHFGGEYWAQVVWNGDLSTVATAATAQVAIKLYLDTHHRHYFAWARRALQWMEHTMRAPNGLFYDRRSTAQCPRHQKTCWPTNGPYGPSVIVPPDPLIYEAAYNELG